MDGELRLHLSEEGADAERLAVLTGYLRGELLQLDVEDVTALPAGEPPPGSRAFDVAAVGALLIAYCVPPRAMSDLARSFLSAALSSPVVYAPPRNPARIDPGPIGVRPAASVAFNLLSAILMVTVPAAESNVPLSAVPLSV